MPRHTGPQPQVSDLPIMHQPFWLFPMKTLPLVVSASVEQGLLGPRKSQEATTPDTQVPAPSQRPSRPMHDPTVGVKTVATRGKADTWPK